MPINIAKLAHPPDSCQLRPRRPPPFRYPSPNRHSYPANRHSYPQPVIPAQAGISAYRMDSGLRPKPSTHHSDKIFTVIPAQAGIWAYRMDAGLRPDPPTVIPAQAGIWAHRMDAGLCQDPPTHHSGKIFYRHSGASRNLCASAPLRQPTAANAPSHSSCTSMPITQPVIPPLPQPHNPTPHHPTPVNIQQRHRPQCPRRMPPPRISRAAGVDK